MYKTIGEFKLEVWKGGHPVWVGIKDERGNEIRFSHESLSDLQHALSEAKKAALSYLPDNYKHEV